MSEVIPTELLNRTVTVKRPSGSGTANADGIVNPLQTIDVATLLRVYRNSDFGGRGTEIEVQGIVGASTHKGAALPTADIQTGDTLVDNSSAEEFKVNLADPKPAGYIGSHMELWLTSTSVG